MNITLFILLFLTSFRVHARANFNSSFVFGVANAPGQVEDNLLDIWQDWGNQGHIKSWKYVVSPEKRLEFWSRPELELDLAQKLGIQSFRMGVDWGRIMPAPDRFDEDALKRYGEIIRMVKARKMKVMLTLMHHSVPKWIMENGGWHNEKTKDYFLKFSQKVIPIFNQDVDQWITFNEANVFVINAYTTGIWPPGEESSPLSLFAAGPIKGSSIKALDLMAEAHNEIYDWAHKKFPHIKMGLAHNMANYQGHNPINKVIAYFADELMNWRFPEKTRGHMDFFGVNYYGAEWLKGSEIDLDPEEEYSESGRAIDVDGFYHLLVKIHRKFSQLPIIITENGTADTDDSFRGAYLIEHLLAIHKAIEEKIPVEGYYVWSLTDNLEWSDGYCPKFGLVGVDRKTSQRLPRASFELFQKIISQREITDAMRDTEWKKVLSLRGKDRPFCRADDGITAYDVPKLRKFSGKDWRFH